METCLRIDDILRQQHKMGRGDTTQICEIGKETLRNLKYYENELKFIHEVLVTKNIENMEKAANIIHIMLERVDDNFDNYLEEIK